MSAPLDLPSCIHKQLAGKHRIGAKFTPSRSACSQTLIQSFQQIMFILKPDRYSQQATADPGGATGFFAHVCVSHCGRLCNETFDAAQGLGPREHEKERTSGGQGKRVPVRVKVGGSRYNKKKKQTP